MSRVPRNRFSHNGHRRNGHHKMSSRPRYCVVILHGNEVRSVFKHGLSHEDAKEMLRVLSDGFKDSPLSAAIERESRHAFDDGPLFAVELTIPGEGPEIVNIGSKVECQGFVRSHKATDPQDRIRILSVSEGSGHCWEGGAS